jgi:hypothetical protein
MARTNCHDFFCRQFPIIRHLHNKAAGAFSAVINLGPSAPVFLLILA